MGCPYFEKGYFFSTCSISGSQYVTVEIMENYCLTRNYRLCPALTAYQDYKCQEV